MAAGLPPLLAEEVPPLVPAVESRSRRRPDRLRPVRQHGDPAHLTARPETGRPAAQTCPPLAPQVPRLVIEIVPLSLSHPKPSGHHPGKGDIDVPAARGGVVDEWAALVRLVGPQTRLDEGFLTGSVVVGVQ